MNITSQPNPKLRVGVQGRYFMLGNFGNTITLDWAAADYKASDKFGARFGKVKIPSGLLNEIQDIDPSYMWSASAKRLSDFKPQLSAGGVRRRSLRHPVYGSKTRQARVQGMGERLRLDPTTAIGSISKKRESL